MEEKTKFEIPCKALAKLVQDKEIKGFDLRVWLLLVDMEASPTELALVLGAKPTNVAASCRKLHKKGWIKLIWDMGNSKCFTAGFPGDNEPNRFRKINEVYPLQLEKK